jgi:hypothetical protein
MPRVRFIVPGFAWRRAEPGQELHSSRAGFLRVYLDRPWFASGDGELLGVVLRPESPVETAELLRVTTQWGRDPLWRTAATTAGPTAEDFAGGEVFENVQLNETGVSTPTTIVAYRPSFDDRGRCFADILLDPHDSYFPFVRFALARYQPNSVPGMEMSAVLQADFAQLAPHRALTVTPDGNDRVEISLSGITHETAVDPENAGRTGTWVRVSIRERIPGTLDEAGWQTIGDLVELNRTELTWHGAVTVPASRTPGAIQLLIEELETYKSVDEVTGAPDLRDRVVFAETYTFA